MHMKNDSTVYIIAIMKLIDQYVDNILNVEQEQTNPISVSCYPFPISMSHNRLKSGLSVILDAS